MNDFEKRLFDLSQEVNSRFLELRELKSEYILFTEEEVENGYAETYSEVRNKNGEIIDVHIIKVDSNGIDVINADDSEKRYYIGFMDLADVADRITLVNLMENQLK
jgi:hypothetical protein